MTRALSADLSWRTTILEANICTHTVFHQHSDLIFNYFFFALVRFKSIPYMAAVLVCLQCALHLFAACCSSLQCCMIIVYTISIEHLLFK